METKQPLAQPAAPTAGTRPQLEFRQGEFSGVLLQIFPTPSNPRHYLRIEAGIYAEQEQPSPLRSEPQPMELRPLPTPGPQREPGIRAGVALRYRFTTPGF